MNSEKLLFGGSILLPSHVEQEVVLVTDKIIITLVLDENLINNTFLDFISNLKSIKASINVQKNIVLDNLMEQALREDMIVRSFLEFHK